MRKTTLAQKVGSRRDCPYLTFDDDVARRPAEADPVAFVGDRSEHTILD